MNKFNMYIYTILLGFSSPFIVNAQGYRGYDLFGIMDTIFFLLARIIPIIFSLALIYFLWGAAEYILKSSDETARTEGRKKMLYGIIALFVMVSVWGLVAILGNTFNVWSGGPSPILPY